MNFVINLNITKILFTKFECEFRMQTEEVGSKKLVIGDARGIAILVLRNHVSCH